MIRALGYFAIPDSLWPVGLQLIRRKEQSAQLWLKRDQQAAQGIVEQISTLLLDVSLDTYPRPSDSDKAGFGFGHCYVADSKEIEGRYSLEWCPDCYSGAASDLPAPLKAAVIQAGKVQHLDLSFSTASQAISKHYCITKYRVGVSVPRAECML